MEEKMSDLDENLSSILSSLIDNDGGSMENISSIPENHLSTESQLDIESIANSLAEVNNQTNPTFCMDNQVNRLPLLELETPSVAGASRLDVSESHEDNKSADETEQNCSNAPIEASEVVDDFQPLHDEAVSTEPQEREENQTNESESSTENIPNDNRSPKDPCSTVDSSQEENNESHSIDNTCSPENVANDVPSATNVDSSVEESQNEMKNNEKPADIDTENITNGDELPPNVNPIADEDQNERETDRNSENEENVEENQDNSIAGNDEDLSEYDEAVVDEVEEELELEDEHLGETIIADEIDDEATMNAKIAMHRLNSERKRRRILVCSSSDSELDEERERILRSKSKSLSRSRSASPVSETNVNASDDNIENESDALYDENSSRSASSHCSEEENDELNQVKAGERPGPRSKKQSTLLMHEMKAKALLQSAVVIPARKKKNRIIDSDDENGDGLWNPAETSLDDIGLITEDNEIQFSTALPEENHCNHAPDVKVKTEQTEEIKKVERRPFSAQIVKPPPYSIPVVIDLDEELNDEPPDKIIKREDIINRRAAQIKIENFNANNLRTKKQPSQTKAKESTKDVFGTPLNAPYVDTSDDEDYFLPEDPRRKNQIYDQWPSNRNFKFQPSMPYEKKKKGQIPNDVYFNSKVPLHVLYSYDDSSSDDERPIRAARPVQHPFAPKPYPIYNNMPEVHRIIPHPKFERPQTYNYQKVSTKFVPRPVVKRPVIVTKTPTVFEQLDQLKKFLKASGIKILVNDLLKGSKTFQERCQRIRDVLYKNGIEGEITMAKCKKLRKRMRLKEEVEGLDTSVIIEANEEGGARPRRRATRRNYVYDERNEPKRQHEIQVEKKEDASNLLRKMKEFIDSDSDDDDKSNFDPSCMVEAVMESNQERIEFSQTDPKQIIQNETNILTNIETEGMSNTSQVEQAHTDAHSSIEASELPAVELEHSQALIESIMQPL